MEVGGLVIRLQDYRELPSVFRLTVFCNPPQEMIDKSISVNHALSVNLLQLTPFRRTMQLETCFVDLLSQMPEMPIIRDIDVLFNPAYQVDVMQLLVSAYKRKPFRLIWPGSFDNGKLVYSEKQYSDYKAFDANAYDILCVKD